MLTLICHNIKNFFSPDSDRLFGLFSIRNGALVPPVKVQDGQYYRIVGSVFNDGVHRSDDTLQDEDEFNGAVWLMRVPQEVIDLAAEMQDWVDKYGGADSPNMSPYSSESFGGYNYSKAQGYASAGGGMLNNVWSVYASRLNPYRKIRSI